MDIFEQQHSVSYLEMDEALSQISCHFYFKGKLQVWGSKLKMPNGSQRRSKNFTDTCAMQPHSKMCKHVHNESVNGSMPAQNRLPSSPISPKLSPPQYKHLPELIYTTPRDFSTFCLTPLVKCSPAAQSLIKHSE